MSFLKALGLLLKVTCSNADSGLPEGWVSISANGKDSSMCS